MIYQNTFVVMRDERTGHVLGWGGHMDGTWRRVFNNIFLQVEDLPTLPSRWAAADLETDHNLFWSVDRGAGAKADFFRVFRSSEAFAASRNSQPPGWEAYYPLYQ